MIEPNFCLRIRVETKLNPPLQKSVVKIKLFIFDNIDITLTANRARQNLSFACHALI